MSGGRGTPATRRAGPSRAGLALMLSAALPIAGATSVAAAEAPIAIAVGGYFLGYAAGVSQNDAPGQPGFGLRDYAIFRKSRLLFDGVSRLDDGVRIGVRIQVRGEANAADQIDQSYLIVGSPYGELRLGKTRGAAYDMHYPAPYPQDSADSGWSLNQPAADFNGMSPPPSSLVARGSSSYVSAFKNEKIVYYAPRIAGFQLGVSFAPDGCVIRNPTSTYDGTSLNQTNVGNRTCGGTIATPLTRDTIAGQQKNLIDGGLNYVAEFGPVKSAFSLGATMATLQIQPGFDNAQYRDHRAWNAGVSLGYAGFVLGAAYAFDNLGTARAALIPPATATYPGVVGKDSNNWNIGLAYVRDRWRAGIQYAYADAAAVDSAGRNRGRDRYQGIGLGGAYRLGPGISLTAGAQWQQWTTWQATSSPTYASAINQGWVYQLGTVLKF